MRVTVRVAALRERKDAFEEAVLAQLEAASLIYFSGGNPAYLADTLRDTPFWSMVASISRPLRISIWPGPGAVCQTIAT